jgi:hypothetical protein
VIESDSGILAPGGKMSAHEVQQPLLILYSASRIST